MDVEEEEDEGEVDAASDDADGYGTAANAGEKGGGRGLKVKGAGGGGGKGAWHDEGVKWEDRLQGVSQSMRRGCGAAGHARCRTRSLSHCCCSLPVQLDVLCYIAACCPDFGPRRLLRRMRGLPLAKMTRVGSHAVPIRRAGGAERHALHQQS